MLTADCTGHKSGLCFVLLYQCPSDLGIPGGAGASEQDWVFPSVKLHIVLA